MLDKFIRQNYRSQNQSRVPTLRCRDSRPYVFPKRTPRTRSKRQPRSPEHARFARTRSPRVSGGLSVIVTQPVLGSHARNASRNSPLTRAQSGVGTRDARRGERCGVRRALLEHSSRHENHIGGMNLCSGLASDSFIMGDNGVLRNTDILESIVNNVPKYSYIHHSADTLYFHNLNKPDIHKFDLRFYE